MAGRGALTAHSDAALQALRLTRSLIESRHDTLITQALALALHCTDTSYDTRGASRRVASSAMLQQRQGDSRPTSARSEGGPDNEAKAEAEAAAERSGARSQSHQPPAPNTWLAAGALADWLGGGTACPFPRPLHGRHGLRPGGATEAEER